MNPYIRGHVSNWDVFNDCMVEVWDPRELPAFLVHYIRSDRCPPRWRVYADTAIRDNQGRERPEKAWQIKIEEAGYGHKIWYLIVRTAKTMVIRNGNLENVVELSRTEKQIIWTMFDPQWFSILVVTIVSELESMIEARKFDRRDLLTKHIYLPPTLLLTLDGLMVQKARNPPPDVPPPRNRHPSDQKPPEDTEVWMPMVLKNFVQSLTMTSLGESASNTDYRGLKFWPVKHPLVEHVDLFDKKISYIEMSGQERVYGQRPALRNHPKILDILEACNQMVRNELFRGQGRAPAIMPPGDVEMSVPTESPTDVDMEEQARRQQEMERNAALREDEARIEEAANRGGIRGPATCQ